MQKPTHPAKEVTLSVLESRLKRAIRPKDRLWAIVRLAEGLLGREAMHTKRALVLFTEAEHLAENIGDRRALATAIRGAGRCYLDLYNFGAALESFDRALPIAEQTGYAECEVTILRDMGYAYVRQSRHDLALKTLQKCTELAELIGNTQVQASALNRMGTTFTDLGRYHEALECHTKSLALFEHTGQPHDQATTLQNLSNALQPLGRYAEAFSALDQAMQLCQAGSRDKGLCQGSIGVIYSEIGDYPNALSSFFASAKILERVGDKLNLARLYVNLVETHRLSGNTEGMKDFGGKALALFEEIGDKRGQAATFGNLGKHYLDRGQKDEAKQLLKRCLALSRETGSKDFETEALTKLAEMEVNFGKFTAAEKLYQNALTIANMSGDRNGTVAALLGLGSLFNKRGEYNQALSFLGRAIEIAREIHLRHHEQEAHQMLAEALETNGDLKRALAHSKLASSIKEEILGTEKQKAIMELQIRSDIEKSEQEKVLLKKEIEIKSQEIERMAMRIMEKTELVRCVSRHIKEIVRQCGMEKRSEFDELLAEITGEITNYELQITNDSSDNDLQGPKSPIRNSQFVIRNSSEFPLVYRDNLRKFSERYPTLTMTERKICVLLADGLSTKEMSLLLKVEPHTIEWHRRHIRKKMKLKRGASLTTVLASM